MTDSTKSKDPTRPDLTKGISLNLLADGGLLQGHVGEDEVLLARNGDTVFAVGAHCTHYRGNLADGLMVGETVRCPLHHACFSVRTGEALRAPALDPLACWRVERHGDTVVVREKNPPSEPKRAGASSAKPSPASVGIVGGGAAALAAADMLRREGYDGSITMISADEDAPVDRPNLSKDYLAGEAQDDWIPLWPPDLYAEKQVDLILRRRVVSIVPAARAVVFEDGSRREFGAILIATGADPVHLPIPGADGSNASSVLRSPLRCARVASPWTWSRPSASRSRRSWAAKSAGMFNPCTRVTASCFTWVRQSRRWTAARPLSVAAAGLRPTSS